MLDESEEGSDERIELCFIFLECSEGVGASVHVAGPAFHASRFEGGEVMGVEGVLAHGGTGPTGVTIGSLNDVLVFVLDS